MNFFKMFVILFRYDPTTLATKALVKRHKIRLFVYNRYNMLLTYLIVVIWVKSLEWLIIKTDNSTDWQTGM